MDEASAATSQAPGAGGAAPTGGPSADPLDDLFAPAALDEQALAPGDRALPLRQLAWLTVRHPRRAMLDLAAHPGRRWIVPVIALALLTAVAAAVTVPQMQAAARAELAARAESMGGDAAVPPEGAAMVDRVLQVSSWAGVFAGLIVPFIALLILAGLLHLTATVLGGQQTFGQMLAVTSWARLPLVLQAALRLVYAFTGGFDARPDGLAGLVDQTSLAGPLLGEVSLWNLWSLALVVMAVTTVSRVSRAKALTAVVLVVLLRVGLGLAGVAIAKVFSGFGN